MANPRIHVCQKCAAQSPLVSVKKLKQWGWIFSETGGAFCPACGEMYMVFHRCIFAAVKEMKHVTALMIAYLYLGIGFTVVVIMPRLDTVTESDGRKAPLFVAGGFLYIFLPCLTTALWYLRWRDLHDEIYEIMPDGIICVTYKTIARFHSFRRGRVYQIESGYPVRKGISQYLFNWGDVYLQVGRAYRPFVLKDVYRPSSVFGKIMYRAGQKPIAIRESALAGVE